MGLSYGGEISIGACLPIVGLAIGPTAAQLNAQLIAAVNLKASLQVTPPSVTAQIAFLTEFLAQLQAGVNLGLPQVSFDLTACATLIANIQANLNLLLQIQGLLATAGVFAYLYTGTAVGLGAAFDSALASGWPDGSGAGAATTAIILGTTTNGTATALTTLFSGV